MRKTQLIIALIFLLASRSAAQDDSATIKQFIRTHAEVLTADAMHGRGYVMEGRGIASAYLQGKFKEYGLLPVAGSHGYAQPYYFKVNTFPGKMKLVINGKELKAGADYHIDASSASITARSLKVELVDMNGVTDIESLKTQLRKFDGSHAYFLTHTDSMCKALGARMEEIVVALPEGCYLIPQKAKLTWTTSTTGMNATVFYIKSDAMPEQATEVTAEVKAVLLEKSRNENLVGMIPGTVKDTFVAFTGHYDHLGMMGSEAMFPGASDNASGIATLLYLASWFHTHPPHYSILFIAFSGEEAGLLGSQYYVSHPLVPLANMKFLTNIDIMGDATDGVTVVNATEYPTQFGLLNSINSAGHYLPIIKSRGKAQNSDHYFFTEAGVPSFFMYSNGGKGYYHDIYDKASELTLNHIAGAARLLIDFAGRIR